MSMKTFEPIAERLLGLRAHECVDYVIAAVRYD